MAQTTDGERLPLTVAEAEQRALDRNPTIAQARLGRQWQSCAELLAAGFSITQIVHDYGDICQAPRRATPRSPGE